MSEREFLSNTNIIDFNYGYSTAQDDMKNSGWRKVPSVEELTIVLKDMAPAGAYGTLATKLHKWLLERDS